MANYSGKKTLLFLGLKYCGNLLSYCSYLPSFQGKFNGNLPPFYSNYQGNVAL
jgi:hypothetical protein